MLTTDWKQTLPHSAAPRCGCYCTWQLHQLKVPREFVIQAHSVCSHRTRPPRRWTPQCLTASRAPSRLCPRGAAAARVCYMRSRSNRSLRATLRPTMLRRRLRSTMQPLLLQLLGVVCCPVSSTVRRRRLMTRVAGASEGAPPTLSTAAHQRGCACGLQIQSAQPAACDVSKAGCLACTSARATCNLHLHKLAARAGCWQIARSEPRANAAACFATVCVLACRSPAIQPPHLEHPSGQPPLLPSRLPPLRNGSVALRVSRPSSDTSSAL